MFAEALALTVVLAAPFPLSGAEAAADDDGLDLIPASAAPATSDGATPHAGKSFVRYKAFAQSDTEASAARASIVPYPPPGPSTWQQHLLLDGRVEVDLAPHLELIGAAREDLRAETGLPFPTHENIRFDVRELYLNDEPLDGLFISVGRINLRNGVAVGYNPTDFFRTKAVVEPLSIDPTVLRETRLGVVAVKAQYLWTGGSATVAYVPKLANARPVYASSTLPSVDPMFDRTNDSNRALLSVTEEWSFGLSTELLGYWDGAQPFAGANLSYGIGDSIVAYAEWSGGQRARLIDAALAYGRATGTIPPAAPSPLAEDPQLRFENDASVGLSYTAFQRLTLNLEYQFHQAGLSPREWNDWFDAGAREPAGARAELWYIRGYANEQQERAARHYAFLRADWPDFVVKDLELTGFVLVNLQEGSVVTQLTADYYLSSAWTVGALVVADLGVARSEFGSLPSPVSGLIKVSYYF